ncbi:MAG: hypothetical protein G01um101448_693 [Parcubacteria group bacterium Gr01-1014_48]|nr:MAG: hypothetical protein G01um101448_693 [Parcubacteria group bacterium Gr01-1014_48]
MIRFLLDIILFILALGGIWWLFVPLVLLSLFWFDRQYESVVAALMMDILYGAPFVRNVEVFYLFSFVCAVAFLSAEVLKKRLRYYGIYRRNL